MGAPFTILFGSYEFPNQTFEVSGLPVSMRLDDALIPRKDGSQISASRIGPRKIRIRGQLHGADENTVHDALDLFIASLAVGGKQQLKYRSDRYLNAWLSDYGHSWAEGAYPQGTGFGGVANIDLQFMADDPYLYSITATTVTQSLESLTGGSVTFNIVNASRVPVVPVYTFVPGITVTNGILLTDLTNGQRFSWGGTLAPGMSLVIDAENYDVTLGDGTDGLTQFDGDFVQLAAATNAMKFAGATFILFTTVYRNRFLA